MLSAKTGYVSHYDPTAPQNRKYFFEKKINLNESLSTFIWHKP